jgi:hypothetical protein
MIKTGFASYAAPAAIGGGLLWIAYAIALQLRPWGDFVTRAAWPQPAVVTNAGAFAATTAMGALALAVLGAAVPAAVQRAQLPLVGSGRFGVAMAWAAILAAIAAAAGGVSGRTELAAAGMTGGEVLLAFGVLLVAIEAAGSPHTGAYGSMLFVVGAVGMLGLMAQALAALAVWMLPVYAALVMAVYGLAWVRFGGWLQKQG